MGLCTQPVHPAFEQGKSSCGFGLDKGFSLTFFTLASSFGNEQAPVTECAHEIRQILVGLALEYIVDPIGSPKGRRKTVSRGTSRASIATLKDPHMRMIL